MCGDRKDKGQINADLAQWEDRALEATAAGDYRQAVEAHQEALAIAARLGQPRLLAVLYNRLGNALEAGNQVQHAVIAYESGLKALAGDPEVGADPASGTADERAIAALRVLSLSSKGFAPSQGLIDVPDLYVQTTDTDLARAEADEALWIKLLINVGNAYLQQPQLGPALAAYCQALEHPEIKAEPLLCAYTLTHVAIIHRRQGDADGAATMLQEALDLFDRAEAAGQDVTLKRRALAALAGIERDRGQLDRAQETFQQALPLYGGSGDVRGHSRVLASLGHLYLHRKRYDRARPAFERALEMARQAGDEETLWHTYWGLGRCLQAAGELDAAADALQRALAKIEARRRELTTDEGKVAFLDSVYQILDRLIEVHLDRAAADPAAQPAAYRDALDVVEIARGQALHDLMGMRRRHFASRQAGYREARWRPFEERPDSPAQMAPGVASPVNVSSMVAQVAPGVPSPGDAPPADFSSMVAQVAPGIASVAPPDLAGLLDEPLWDEDAEPLIEKIEATAATPSLTTPRPAGEEQPPPPLPPLAHLVFHVLPARTAVLAVAPDGSVVGHAAAVGREELTARVAALRRALRVDDAPRGVTLTRDARPRQPAAPAGATDPEPLLRALYADLIAPLAGSLPSDGTPVVVEPHGPLWLLPFAALQDADGTWLADRWPLLFAPSAEVLNEIRRDQDYGAPGELRPLLIGNPVMPPLVEQDGLELELEPLPGAELEARAIAGLFGDAGGAGDAGPTLLLGPAADWASVVAQMPLHGIVHLATHGLADAQEPLDSFVALGVPDPGTLEALDRRWQQGSLNWPQSRFFSQFLDRQGPSGLLTAEQILYLPLPADLVTLSACQTGLGQISGDGMIGLARSFLVAGARAVLVSQWSVSDEATAELMLAFYRHYLALDDKALALQRAMCELRAKPEYAHPRYWAPFVVVGAEA